MATITAKVDSGEIPSLLKMFGLGGIPREALDDSGADQPAASVPDAQPAPQPQNDARGIMAMFGGPPPIDSSMGGADNPTMQPGDTPAPPETKLGLMQRVLSGGAPEISAGANQPGPIARPTQDILPDDIQGGPQVAGPTFRTAHPSFLKALGLVSTLVADAAPGIGARTFGEGAQAAEAAGQRRAAAAFANVKTQADIANEQAETRLHGVQADQAAQTVTIMTPQGPVTGPLSQLKSAFPAMFAAQSRQNVATINAASREDVAQLRQQIDAGKIKAIRPAVDDNGNAVLAAYDNQGNLMKYLPRSIGPAWMLPTVRSSVDIKEDGNGGFIYVPKTSTTRRVLPAQPSAGEPTVTQQPGTPAAATPQGGAPQQRNTGAGPQGGGVRPVTTGQVRPVTNSQGQQVGGKTSIDAGYAFDPQSGNTVLTTRGQFANQGFQNFRKVSQKDIDNDRQIINRLNDVETKLGRYSDVMASDQLTGDDQNKLAYLINSDKFKFHVFGAELPIDEINNFLRQGQLGDLSPAGQKAFAAYLNARESMSGYQRVLSGSSRGSDKTMELNIDALPKPTDPKSYIAEGINQFRENIPIMRRGLPILPGVNDGRQNGNQGAGSNGNPSGGKYLPWFKPVR